MAKKLSEYFCFVDGSGVTMRCVRDPAREMQTEDRMYEDER